MEKINWVICSNYRKCKSLKISYIFEITLVPSIICSNCENEDEQISNEKE